jgi:hypothetical protein
MALWSYSSSRTRQSSSTAGVTTTYWCAGMRGSCGARTLTRHGSRAATWAHLVELARAKVDRGVSL